MLHFIIQVADIIAGRLIRSAGVPLDGIFQFFDPCLVLFFIIILSGADHAVRIRLRNLQRLDAGLPHLLVVVLAGIRLGNGVNDIVAEPLRQLFQLLKVIPLRKAGLVERKDRRIRGVDRKVDQLPPVVVIFFKAGQQHKGNR